MSSPAFSLPPLDPDSARHSARAAAHLRQAIAGHGGWLPFDGWMAQALYAPGLGYYAAGNIKLASPQADARGVPIVAGDFITAPELTPLFGRTVARQVAQVLADTGTDTVLEFGAGTGALADSVLAGLDAQGMSAQYRIIEVSADLRARQQARLAAHGARVQWLDALPDSYTGCVLANEVLDAMPVSLFRWSDDGMVLERGVAVDAAGGFTWEDRPAGLELARAVAARMPPLPGYVSEINLQGEAWMRAMGGWLKRGAALLFDYGFPRREYYHPQRAGGTLMCHLRHHAHADPLAAPGVQDITAHVDFTAMADAALAAGLQVLGYTSQARFLMNAGLADLLARHDPADARAYAQAVAPVQKLLSEAEMGELFKVLAVGRGIEQPLHGFARGDRLTGL
ncbi:class I SAM-dependent methyltransferase [Bordetella petrii]|uniref:class I SAM-dependent methyltransferase n=1 Tax=Bordetella petrii TaxID=94624 RepID=UPI001E640458|nr:SAM-dependent methyltransferase [Bordetella petrii]MCD0503496.1 SAM-dependent methyltransferase [Bordetella petrii]